MPRKSIALLLVIVCIPLLFKAVDGLLQHPFVYNHTLGKLSTNYSQELINSSAKIVEVNKPYLTPTKSNFYNWDGAYYSVLRDSLYAHSGTHPDRAAFFPLYSMLLRIVPSTSPTAIFILNLLLLGLGIFFLVRFTFPETINYFIVVAGFLLPTVVVFYMPYAECLLIFSVGMAVIGLKKKNYWLYCLGMLAFSITRPAVYILLLAFFLAEISLFLQHRNFRYFIVESIKKVFPVIAGVTIVTAIQYAATGSITAYFDATSIWQNESGFFGNEISDWSSEGYGMNAFSIFLIILPATVYCITQLGRNGFSKSRQTPPSLFEGNNAFNKDYMFSLSLFFIAGHILMLIFMSGGALNGYSRYTMSVPFFYIVLYQLPERFSKFSLKLKLPFALACIILLFFFLNNVHYTGILFRFAYMGLYLLLALLLFILLEPHLPAKSKAIILLILLLPCIVWQTYLFNMYLSNAWIFT